MNLASINANALNAGAAAAAPPAAVASSMQSRIFSITPRRRYRVMVEWACQNTSDAFTIVVRWYDSTQTIISTETLFSDVAATADDWQVETFSVVPPATARFARVGVRKPAVSTLFAVGRIEMRTMHESTMEQNSRKVTLFDDFFGAGTTIGMFPWTRTDISGTLTVSKGVPTNAFGPWSENGIVELTTPATTGQGGGIGIGQGFAGPPAVGGECRIKVRLSSATNVRAWAGLFDVLSTSPDGAKANTIYGIGFRYEASGSASTWQGILRNGTNETNVDLGVGGDTSWYELGWARTSTGIVFLVNGIPTGAVQTTNIIGTSQALSPIIGIVTGTTAAKVLQADYYGLEMYVTRIR